MAMSLEDLLAKEGFKRRKEKTKPRISSASEGRSIPLYMQYDKHETGSVMAVKRTERTRSDIPRYDSRGEFSTSSSFIRRKLRDNLSCMGEIHLESEKRNTLNYGRSGHRDSWDTKRFSIASSKDLRGSEITEVVQRDEKVEVGINRPYRGIYSNKVYSHKGNEGKSSARHDERETYSNGIFLDNNKDKDKSFKNKTSEKANFGESRGARQEKFEEVVAAPALDEVAVKAVISIFSGYVKRSIEDEDFRTSLHHNSFVSLNLFGLSEGIHGKVVENLKQAIEIVERAAEDRATLKELKKASLQLSVITGLNSNDLKDGFTSGIPNSRLSACAHLYLSVIHVLQKKDGIAAKHLLQVFCNSPFQARTTLLPDLWDQVFLPHFFHLKLWYDKEVHSVADSPVLVNLEVLKKAYNGSLDLGTYEFAMYYKDWITEGVEAPSAPSIRIPSFSIHLKPRGGSLGHTSSPASYASPQPMVSKTLYNDVFRHSYKAGIELEIYEDDNYGSSAAGSSNILAPEDKLLILYTHDSATQTNKRTEGTGSPTDNIPVVEEKRRLHVKSSPGESNLHENLGSSERSQGKLHSLYMLQELLPVTEDRPVSERKQIVDSVNSVQYVQGSYEYPRGKHSLCSIPIDFLCPLTGLLFKDPVTLETGQTFEREAIMKWFGKGCMTCPVTRKVLKCEAVPPTNLILKRVIDKWKIDHIEHLLALISTENIERSDDMIVCILGQLLPVLRKDERVINAQRFISFGGVQFLLRRFPFANTQEKTFILTLLCCCIEADEGCRNEIARNINLSNLLELLHNEQLKLTTNSVLLLIELICFNRRSRAKSFLEGLHDEEIINALDHLCMYLHTCFMEETPLVAVLILHLDLLSERHTSNMYRQEAVDALTVALEISFSDVKVNKKCCRALLILGGCFSSSGKLMTEDWILKLTGFLNGPDGDIAEDESNDVAADGTKTMVNPVTKDEEETAKEKWLARLSASLVGEGNKSFLHAVSKCLGLGNSDLVRVCLTTVAWLSFSVASLHDRKLPLNAFSALISPLKQCLEYGQLVEHKILASLSLLNFSAIPECRKLLMEMGEEVGPCLENLAEVTWTAKELHTIIK